MPSVRAITRSTADPFPCGRTVALHDFRWTHALFSAVPSLCTIAFTSSVVLVGALETVPRLAFVVERPFVSKPKAFYAVLGAAISMA